MNQSSESISTVSAHEHNQTRPKRYRRPLPVVEARDWMTAEETALALGCSIATIHRLRRGLIAGVAILPAVAIGTRKFIFRKATVAQWQDQSEKGTA
jgi:hypothetical protein